MKTRRLNGLAVVKSTTRLPARPALRVASTEAAHKLLWTHFVGLDREHLWRIDLDARRGLLGAELVSIGGVDAVFADPRLIFRGALAVAASGVILMHNHISGDVTPSPQDRVVASRIDMCGLILGVNVIDHVIVSNDKWSSMRAAGY